MASDRLTLKASLHAAEQLDRSNNERGAQSGEKDMREEGVRSITEWHVPAIFRAGKAPPNLSRYLLRRTVSLHCLPALNAVWRGCGSPRFLPSWPRQQTLSDRGDRCGGRGLALYLTSTCFRKNAFSSSPSMSIPQA